MKILCRAFKIFGRILLGIVIFIVVYAGLAYILSQITVNRTDQDPQQDVVIYIKTNGVHTDLVVPISNEIMDWNALASPLDTKSKNLNAQYVAFGWGDKGFYLNTPEWSDLKVSTALNAAFYMGTTAIHATFYESVHENDTTIKVNVSRDEYRKLCDFISASFQTDSSGRSLLIAAPTYGHTDSFYEAHGKYNLFYTCNSWTNNALKASGQKAALWSLTDSGIFCHYQQ